MASDTKFMLVIYDRYFPLLRGGTIEDAVQAALEEIYSGETGYEDDGDLPFEIIEVTSSKRYSTYDYQEFFEKKYAAEKKRREEQQNRLEREQFERLKKKFNKEAE